MNSKLFFGLVFIFGISFSAYSQVFAPLGAKWTFVQPNNYYNIGNCDYSDKIKSFEVYEERIIDGTIYNVLRLDSVDLLTYREDSQKVYYYENDSVYLLMDFNLTVGDTLKVRFPSTSKELRLFDCCYTPLDELVYNVIYKDTVVIIEAKALRQLHFSSYYLTGNPLYEYQLSSFAFTERIGDFSSPLSLPISVCCLAEFCSDIFLCYQDNEWGYDNAHAEYNCQYTSVENKLKLNNVEVYPNPADKILNIKNIGEAEVSITHLDGKILFQNIFQNNATINTEKLNPGVYYVMIKSQQNTAIKKIVISH